MTEISSKNNVRIKDLIKLRDDAKFRNDKSLFYVEGEIILNDTPIELIESIFIEKSKIDNFKYFINKFNTDKINIVDDSIFNKIKDTKNSQGIIGVVKYNNFFNISRDRIDNIKSCLILDNINDPGNLGTIIRLSEASSIDLLILCNYCCSIYNPKVLRASMSSIFRINICVTDNIVSDIEKLKNNNFKIYASIISENAKQFNLINFTTKHAVIVGNEANGVSNELILMSDDNIYIPMCGKIQSLNVAVASTVICYEIMRQNNYYET